MRKQISLEMANAMAEMYRDGFPLHIIGTVFGFSKTSVAEHLDRLGCARRCGDARSQGQRPINLSERRFGKLYVMYPVVPRRYPARWVVRCDCGRITNLTTRQITTRYRSCGQCAPRGFARRKLGW